MDFIQKVVISNGVDADTTITINKYSNEVAAINTLLEGISSGRGVANYSVTGSKFTLNFSGVGANILIAYVNGMAIEAGGINTITPFDDIIYPTSTITDTFYPSDSGMGKEIVISPRRNNTLKDVNLTNITLSSYFVRVTNLRQDTSINVAYASTFVTLLPGESLILEKVTSGGVVYKVTKISSNATDISFISVTSNEQDILLTNEFLNSSKRVVQLVWASGITSCNLFVQVGWPNKTDSIPDNFIFNIVNPYIYAASRIATVKPWFDDGDGNEILFSDGREYVELATGKSLEFYNIGGGSPYIIRMS